MADGRGELQEYRGAVAGALQAKWERLAELDPLWSIWTDPAQKGRKWRPAPIYAHGARQVAALFGHIEGRLGYAAGSALDFGCGVGRLTRALAGRFETVLGVDVSRRMVRYARRHTPEPNVRYLVNSAPDLQSLEGPFDFVLTLNTLQHMPPLLATHYVRELVRLLAVPDGLAIFGLPGVPRTGSPYRGAWDATHAVSEAEDADGYPAIDLFGVPPAVVRAEVEAAGGKLVDQWEDASVVGWLGYTYAARRVQT